MRNNVTHVEWTGFYQWKKLSSDFISLGTFVMVSSLGRCLCLHHIHVPNNISLSLSLLCKFASFIETILNGEKFSSSREIFSPLVSLSSLSDSSSNILLFVHISNDIKYEKKCRAERKSSWEFFLCIKWFREFRDVFLLRELCTMTTTMGWRVHEVKCIRWRWRALRFTTMTFTLI